MFKPKPANSISESKPKHHVFLITRKKKCEHQNDIDEKGIVERKTLIRLRAGEMGRWGERVHIMNL
jgi:hypothetical protein